MNKMWKAAIAAALVVTTAQMSYAQETEAAVAVNTSDAVIGHNGLTISGAVGLPLNPTANVPNAGGVRVQANYYDLGGEDILNTNFRLYGIYAAGSISDRLEISGGVEKFSARSDDPTVEDALDNTGLAIGAKYQVYRNATGNTFGAVGVGYSDSLYNNIHAYAVGSHAFNLGSRSLFGHLGLRYDRFEVDAGGFDLDSSKVSVFAGAELPIDRRGRFNLVGELQSKNAEEGLGGTAPYSLSLRYQTPRGLAASVGIARQGVFGENFDAFDGDDSGLFAQVGYSF